MATPDRIEWARQCVVDSTLYFAQPSSFNDPFEFAFVIDYDGTCVQWRAFLSMPEVRVQMNLPPTFVPTDHNIRVVIKRFGATTPAILPT